MIKMGVKNKFSYACNICVSVSACFVIGLYIWLLTEIFAREVRIRRIIFQSVNKLGDGIEPRPGATGGCSSSSEVSAAPASTNLD